MKAWFSETDENGYTVIELADGDDYLTAVGIMPQVSSGDVVKLTGKYTNHPSYGRQFAVQICEISRPTEAADILRYLSSGAIKGIGTQTAQRLVKEFGEATLDVLENQPERVAMLKGISSQKAEDFSKQLKQNTGVRTLMLFLGEYGISNTASVKIFNAYGPSCVDLIKKNPYILCQGDFGVSFESADFIAKKEKLEPDSNVRMRAGIVHILHHNERNGHTCLPKEKLLKVSTDFLGIDGEKVSECMEEMLFDRSLIEDKIDDKKFVFPPNVHLCEMYIASRIKMLLKFPSEKIKNIDKAIEKCEKRGRNRICRFAKESNHYGTYRGYARSDGRSRYRKNDNPQCYNKNNESKRQNCFAFCPHRQSGTTNERTHGR